MGDDEVKLRLMADHNDMESQPEEQVKQTRHRAGMIVAVVLLLAAPMILFPALPKAAFGCLHHTRGRAQEPVVVVTSETNGIPILVIEDLSPAYSSHSKLSTRAVGNSTVCTTESCVAYANAVKANMAKNYKEIDPCEDFSTYVCKGWVDTHDYRPDQSSVSVGSVMSDTSRDLLHSIMEAPYSIDLYTGENKTADENNFATLKKAYDTCMNQDAIRSYGVAPLTALWKEFDQLYPEEASNACGIDSKKELTDASVWLAKHGVGGLVSSGVSSDDKEPDLQVISVGAGEYGLPSKEYYAKPDVVANYTRTIAQMFEIMNSGKAYGNETVPVPASGLYSLEWAKNIVNLESKIANASPDPEFAGKPEYYYKPKPVSEIDAMVPEFSITDFLVQQAPKDYKVNTVILSDTYYFGNLSSIIKETPRATLHAYFRWNVLRGWYGRLHKDYTRPSRVFNNQLAGRDDDAISARWRTCISEVDNISGGVGWLLSAVYIDKAFSPAAKDLGDRIVRDIRTEFVSRLQNFDWMTDAVKKAATDKVKNVVQKIGYPTASPNLLDPLDLEKFYQGLNVTTNYFENARQYTIRAQTRSWDDLLRPTNRDRFEMSTPTVNAYYEPSKNSVNFPAGIMQMPAFSMDLPEYVSYGAFGSVAGHELTHGFDDNGSKYDENGRLRTWWDNTTQKNFDDRAQCFVDQFNKYTITQPDGTKLNVNGKLTLGENIADAGGISASFSAWQKRHATNPSPLLPGLEEFTPEQMFFVSYSTWWCGKVRPAQAVNYIYTDPHSPATARILGTTANAAGFREAFNCPVKKPTCTLW